MTTKNQNSMTTTLPQNSLSSKLSTDKFLSASYRAYFENVLFPLWIDTDPDNPLSLAFRLNDFGDILTNLAILADGDRGLIEKIQQWGLQKEHVTWELVNAFTSSSKPSIRYQDLNDNADYEAILTYLEEGLRQLGMQLDVKDARKALEAIADVCQDEAEFSKVTDGMRGLTMFDEKGWINAIVDFKRRINDRRFNKSDKNDLTNKIENAKLEIKKWLLEDDPLVKSMMKAQICRVTGLEKKEFDAIADSLNENSSKAKTKKLTLSEFLLLPTTGNPQLAPGVASMGVTIFAGNPGAGKTTLAYDLAGAVLMGDEFLGEVPSRQGSVLFVACDESHQWGQDKLINRGIAGNVTDDKVTILQDWDVAQWSDLEMTVEDMRPTLVIVDSFNAIHNDPNFDENSAQASQTAKKLERLSAKYCVPIVLIHHLGKSKDNQGVNKLRGSSAIAASVSSVLILEGEGTTKRLYQPKIRGSEPLNLMVEMDAENGRFRVTSGNVTDDETKSLKQKLIDLFAANPGVMFENSELRDRFIGTERKTLTNALNKILGTVIGNGKIIKRPSRLNQKFKVYGLECTTEEGLSPLPTLSLSNSPLNSGDYEAENFTTQALEVVTSLSPDCHLDCHHLEEDKTTMTTETLVQSDLLIVTTESVLGDEREATVNDDNANVLTQTDAIADDTQTTGKWIEPTEVMELNPGQWINDTTFGPCFITGYDSKADRYTVEFPDKSVTLVSVDDISAVWVTG